MALQSLNALSDGAEVSGDVLLKEYQVRKTKRGSDYISGTFVGEGGYTAGFKVWSGGTCEALKTQDKTNTPVTVVGRVDEYNGVKSLVIESMADAENVDPLSFYPETYPAEALENLYANITGKLTPDGVEILNMVMEPYGARFQDEFAAIYHHDAVPHGLLAHSLKVARIAIMLTNMYPNITQRGSDKDFYILAALFHDIGKIYEYNMGVFADNGWLTHRYFGVRIFLPLEKRIVELKGQCWFDKLMSVITQHHGQWAERPETVEAAIIHRADHLEATLTDINTAMADPLKEEVRLDDWRLRF